MSCQGRSTIQLVQRSCCITMPFSWRVTAGAYGPAPGERVISSAAEIAMPISRLPFSTVNGSPAKCSTTGWFCSRS